MKFFYEVEVAGNKTINLEVRDQGKTRCVCGSGLGCSRDYPTQSNETAVRTFLSENGMRYMGMRLHRMQ